MASSVVLSASRAAILLYPLVPHYANNNEQYDRSQRWKKAKDIPGIAWGSFAQQPAGRVIIEKGDRDHAGDQHAKAAPKHFQGVLLGHVPVQLIDRLE